MFVVLLQIICLGVANFLTIENKIHSCDCDAPFIGFFLTMISFFLGPNYDFIGCMTLLCFHVLEAHCIVFDVEAHITINRNSHHDDPRRTNGLMSLLHSVKPNAS